MPAVLRDFHPLKPAEQTLVNWLQAGQRGWCKLGERTPSEGYADRVTLRATFVRYLALGGCDACRLPETGLLVQGAYIEGDDDKGGYTRGLDLEGATIKHDLGFLDCRFPDLLVLRSARLRNLFLNRAHLGKGVRADRLTCDGGVFLRQAKVAGPLRLIGARIDRDFSCLGAQLLGAGSSLHADRLICNGSVILRQTMARQTLRLVGAKIGGDLDCDGVQLRDTGLSLVADKARISGSLLLRNGAQIAGALDLTASRIGAIRDDPACWPQAISLDRCRYGAFLGPKAPVMARERLKWLALQNGTETEDEFRPSSYEQCAKVLRTMGYRGQATKVMIRKEHLQRRARHARLRRVGLYEDALIRQAADGVLRATVGYGRQPLRAFAWLALLWLIGVGVFGAASSAGEVKPNLPLVQRAPEWAECAEFGARRRGDQSTQVACFSQQPEGLSYPSFNALIYSADTLFPLVSLEMQVYWLPDGGKPWGQFARIYLWFHIAAGWGLSLLAVAGFSGLIKNDTSS